MLSGLLSTVPRSRLARVAAGAALTGVAIFFLSLAIQDIWVADLWWQLRTGQWIVDHGTVPSVDTLSYTVAGQEWIEMRWLYCLAAFLGWRTGGSALLILAETAILALSFLVLAWPSRRVLLTLPGALMLALGVWAGSTRFVVRPELVSYLLLPVFLVVLDGLRRGQYRRAGWALPALQIVWANSHTLFIFGPVLAWTFAAGDALVRLVARLGGPGGGEPPAGGAKPERPRQGGPARSLRSDADGCPVPADSSAEAEGGGIVSSAHPHLLAGLLDRRMALVAALVTAASWVNPYFHRGAMFPFLLFREIQADSILGRTITEFRSPFAIELWTTDITAAMVLAIVSAATFALNWRRTDFIRLAVWAAHLYLGGVAVRNLGLFAFAAAWASLRNLQDVADAAGARAAAAAPREAATNDSRHPGELQDPRASPSNTRNASQDPGGAPDGSGTARLPSGRSRSSGTAGAGTAAMETPSIARGTGTRPSGGGAGAVARLIPFAQIALALGLLVATWYVVTGRYNVVYGCEARFGLGIVECNIPGEATEFLLASGASPQIFHAMSDGSYLAWAAKDRYPVFVDGRLEVYGEAFIEQYLNVARQDWEAFADHWKIDVVMAHREHLAPLITKILASPRWALVHLDPREIVFVRDIPGHAALIARDRIDPRAPWTPRHPEPREEPSGWRRLIGSVARPWYSFGMAETFLALGSPGNAARYLDRAIPYLSVDPRLRLRLGQLWFQAGDYARSAQVLREALAIVPSDPSHWCELGQAHYMAGEAAEAMEAYEKALRLDPRKYEAHFNLGVMLARRGDLSGAAGHFRDALVARPGDPAAERALRTIEAMRAAPPPLPPAR